MLVLSTWVQKKKLKKGIQTPLWTRNLRPYVLFSNWENPSENKRTQHANESPIQARVYLRTCQ